MKIAILTHPLWTNYGGILQAYALQTILRRRGHEVEVINREQNDFPSLKLLILRIGSIFKCLVRIYIFRQKEYIIMNPLSAFYHIKWKGYDVLPFVRENIIQSPQIRNSKKLNQYFREKEFDCYIVGSDQVWRPSYTSCITDYFLKEVPACSGVKRIAYAASFGTDLWEFSPLETEICMQLARRFDAISVREESGVLLCEKYLGIKAIQLLDPTMLLEVQDYKQLFTKAGIYDNSDNIFCYMFDINDEAQKGLDDIKESGYEVTNATIDVCANSENSRPLQMSVEQWLSNICKSKLVITDSFHACVFSILFNTPFVVWTNEERGNTRVESLLNMFDLQDRIVKSYSDFKRVKDNLFIKLNSNKISGVINNWQAKTWDFLDSVGL